MMFENDMLEISASVDQTEGPEQDVSGIIEHERQQEFHLLNPNWVKTSLDVERGEVKRTANDLGIDQTLLERTFEEAKLENLDDATWSIMINTDSREGTWTVAEVRKHLKGKRDPDPIVESMKNGGELSAPVVLFRSGEKPYLIGGNTRLLVCRAVGARPKILAVRL